MNTMYVQVIGDDIEGIACAAALHQLDIPFRWMSEPNPLPDVQSTSLLNHRSLGLIHKLFPDIEFSNTCHAMNQRLMRWSKNSVEPIALAQDSLCISTVQLKQSMLASMAKRNCMPQLAYSEDLMDKDHQCWQIWTGVRALQALQKNQQFTRQKFLSGRRTIESINVKLSNQCHLDSYCIESSKLGWMTLTPHNAHNGTINWCSLQPDSFIDWLQESTLIGSQVCTVESSSSIGPASHINLPVAGSFGKQNWLICGEQVAKLDPFCAENIAFLLESAKLAANCIESVLNERVDSKTAKSFYQATIARQFIEHLKSAIRYYDQAFADNASWSAELARMLLLSKGLETTLNPDQWADRCQLKQNRLYCV